MGEDKLNVLLEENLALAVRTQAVKPANFTKAIVDTNAQPKAATYPTDAKLTHRAHERLFRLARKLRVELRQSCARVGEHALIKRQRYAHAKQFKRAGKALRTLRTYLGRVIRDIVRKAKGDPELMLGRRVHAGNCNLNRFKGVAPDADPRASRCMRPKWYALGRGERRRQSRRKAPNRDRVDRNTSNAIRLLSSWTCIGKVERFS